MHLNNLRRFPSVLCCVLVLLTPLPSSATVNIIVDTDIGPDCDDVGALCLLHNMANNGEAVILGMACCTSSPWGAPCLDAINTYFGRPKIPVGTYKGSGFLLSSPYNQDIAQHWTNRIQNGTNAPDAVALYRQILSQQPDQSVVFVAIGPLNNLANLLKSPADSYSPLNGRDLVAAKVRALSDMGGDYPSGAEWNLQQDGAAAQYVFDNWPAPIMCSGGEIGNNVMSGALLSSRTASDNPVRRAYEDYVGVGKSRNSWDLTAMLYAVRGLSNYWSSSASGYNQVGLNGANSWRSAPDKGHRYLIAKMNTTQLGNLLDAMLVGTAKNSGNRVVTPVFSPIPGNYLAAQAVTISTTIPGATIRYTLDGSTPSETNGTVYPGPVTIQGGSTILKAMAYEAGMEDSSVASGSYTIGQRPAFLNIRQANGAVVFSWTAVIGLPYQVQTTASIAATNWNNLGGISTATNGTMTATDPVGPEAQRFYRVVLLP